MKHAWHIEYVSRAEGEAAWYGGHDAQGAPWRAASEDLIREIEVGKRICYVTFEGESHLVQVQVDGAGRKSLHTLAGELRMRLPEYQL